MSGALVGWALASAVAAAPAADEPPRLELAWTAPEPERPDVRNLRQRRRASREEALGWLGAAVDDAELASAAAAGREPERVDFADFAEPSSGTPGVVWHRPSLLTLGEVPNQPTAAEWQRWQAAVLEARRWAERRR